jgi:hypothetical protein
LARVILCAGLALVYGCSTSFHAGNPPPIEQLASLMPGVSTVEETTHTLGVPQGKGASALSRGKIQDVLVYQYLESSGEQTRTRTLLIFLDHQSSIYQGYMWFRSGQVIGVNQ